MINFKNKIGFSLIELLVALTITGILCAISIPLYSQHIVKARRLEAAATLTNLALALEEYFTEHHSYKDATPAKLGFADKIAHEHYQLIIVAATDTNFKISAEPLAEQAIKDQECLALTLNSLGEENITGHGNWKECW